MFKDFCQSTSLHGYSYLYGNNKLPVKCFWLFVILAMTGLGILFIVLNTQQFLEARIETTIETSTAPLSVRYVLLICSWFLKNQDGQTWCFVYLQLDFYYLCNLQNSSLKYTKNQFCPTRFFKNQVELNMVYVFFFHTQSYKMKYLPVHSPQKCLGLLLIFVHKWP